MAKNQAAVAQASGDKAEDDKVTPMMAQFLEIKSDHQDCLLFYRMGDFYELFFDDAVKAAEALDITLTKRGKHLGEDIPMCGVPVHSADSYLARLIRKGFKVAVGEQTEDPAEAKKRGSKSVVRREVVRIVTPGTLTEDVLLDARSNNFLVALARVQDSYGLAWVDISTGDFHLSALGLNDIDAELGRLNPGEILVSDTVMDTDESLVHALRDWGACLSFRPATCFDSSAGERRIKSLFNLSVLDGLGAIERAELAAAGAVIDYLEETQKSSLPRLTRPQVETVRGTMAIDRATRRNLELSETLSGDRKGSLLATVDRTVTGAGARLLASRLNAPLTDPARINDRLDLVGWFLEREPLRQRLRERLRRTPDMERALSRLSVGRGGPRDLAAVRDSLATAAQLKELLYHEREQDSLGGTPADLSVAMDNLGDHVAAEERLGQALKSELPITTRDGGFVAKGFDDALDEFRTLRDESRRLIAGMEGRYRDLTGIAALKIKHNNVLGYHIEVKPAQAGKMMEPPLSAEFTHRQTLANAVRFNTADLAELAGKISEADVRALARELEIFEQLTGEVLAGWDAYMTVARALAGLDVATALAELAAANRYTRPTVDDSLEFSISGGRHPVVEAVLKQTTKDPFVANDCDLSPDQNLWLITGPNMAGKSTFLRQNALIAVMAQMGSFVPAEAAHIGAVDCLFSRVGASDDLARGRSTFMVEMVETAAILNQATDRSLVILDEIGRGTSTYDGLSIAWATVEYLHEVNRCRGLFATHYHELKVLAERLQGLALHAMRVKEWKGEVVFLHEVGPGSADRSYGVQVGRLAGLPAKVIARAEQVLGQLEESGQTRTVLKLADDLPLFAALEPEPSESKGASPVEGLLDEVNPDDLTPKSALELVYRLKSLRDDP
jgi:DNA mismatch repair protein MutS